MSKKVLCLVLAILMIFQLGMQTLAVDYNNTNETVLDLSPFESDGKSDEIQDHDFLINFAKEYIAKYNEVIYLYKGHDLIENTIVSFASKNVEKQYDERDITVTFNGKEYSVEELSASISRFNDFAVYYRYTRSAQNIERYDFEAATDVQNVVIHDDYAKIHLYTDVFFRYEEGGELAECGDNYIVEFGKIAGEWYIIGVLAEEQVANGFANSFDLDEEIRKFEDTQKNVAENERIAILEATNNNLNEVNNANLTVTKSYNKNNAAAYAYTYTTGSYTASTGNNANFLNDNFYDYSSWGGNCQNFASQCVWAGFGGSDNYSSIHSFSFPMDTQGSNQWYGREDSTKSYSWAHTTYFANYASSTDSTGTRMNTSVYTLESGNNFYRISNAPTSLVGAVLHVEGGEGNYSHAIVVTGATGTAFSQVEFCGNSPMRKAVKLSDCSSYISNPIRVIIPNSMVRSIPCTASNHTYGTSLTGVPCLCTNCGYNRLVVSTVNYKPVALNSTVTLYGSANVRCYRMAIGVIPESGASSWREFTNTTSGSFSYTFRQRGLYEVEVSARDISDAEPDSVKTTQVIHIRVY